MKQPRFLVLEEVLRIHAHQIEQYGGSFGVRDAGLLLSAVAAPQASFAGGFLHGTPFEMAGPPISSTSPGTIPSWMETSVQLSLRRSSFSS